MKSSSYVFFLNLFSKCILHTFEISKKLLKNVDIVAINVRFSILEIRI